LLQAEDGGKGASTEHKALVIDPLKKRKVAIEEPLADTTKGTQKIANVRPDAFLGITMHFAHAIPIVIPCVLTNGMTDGAMNATGLGESGVPSRLVGVHNGCGSDPAQDSEISWVT
jgi:hypothetical protein